MCDNLDYINKKIDQCLMEINSLQDELISYYESGSINKVFGWIHGYSKKNNKLAINNKKAELGSLINIKEDIVFGKSGC